MNSSPTWAASPVPAVTTSESMSFATCPTFFGKTRVSSGLFTFVPFGPSTSLIATGPFLSGASEPDTLLPSFASVEYAYAISSGVTPSSRPPSSMAGFVERSVRMPIRRAMRATRFGPTSMPSSANTELSEAAVAVRGEVEGAGVEVRAAHHRLHRAGLVLDGHERRARAHARQAACDRALGGLLQIGVQRGLHLEPASEHHARAVQVEQVLGHPAREVGMVGV